MFIKHKQKRNRLRWRQNKKNSTRTTFSTRFKTEIKKIKKDGTSKNLLEKILSNTNNFIGVYSHNELNNIAVLQYPVFLVVNIDNHFITMRIDYKTIEIFDSLGKSFQSCKNLLLFLTRYRHYKIIYSGLIQSPSSLLCGLYCIYFIIFRQNHSFQEFTNLFKNTPEINDVILLDSLDTF